MIAKAAITRLKDAVDLIERLGIAERVIAVNLWNTVRIQVREIADVNALPAEWIECESVELDGKRHVVKTYGGIEIVGVSVIEESSGVAG